MIHTPHDDILEAGLDSACPRCQELAADPVVNLDSANLHRIMSGHVYSDLDREALARLSWYRARLQQMEGA
jgi:hypothetical protein